MKEENLIRQAEEFAKRHHQSQKQATGKPYFEHPKEVAKLLKNWNQDEEVIASGYLHDVVEDCNVSLAEIKNKFGERIAYLVDGMSWIRTPDGKDFDATYKKFANYAKKEPVLVLIKLADMTSNIPNISAKNNRKWVIEKSYPRNMAFYIPFIKAVGLTKQADKIINEFHKYTKVKIKSALYNYISKKEIEQVKKHIKTQK